MGLVTRRQFIVGIPTAAIAVGLGVWSSGHTQVLEKMLSHQGEYLLPNHPRLPPERPVVGTGPLFPGGVAIDFIVDGSSSTLGAYAADAKARVADGIDSLVQPGQGQILVFNNEVGPRSIDSRSSFLPFIIPPTPWQPRRREPRPRPPEPDFSPCEKKTFGKQRCRADIAAKYGADLAVAVADEEDAQADYVEDLGGFDRALAEARAAARVQSDALRAYEIKPTDIASDIMGAFLVAAANLYSVRARVERLFLFCQSDLVPYGHQSEGVLRLDAVHVSIINWDVRDARVGRQVREYWEARLRDAGVASLRFLTPAQTAVADLLEV